MESHCSSLMFIRARALFLMAFLGIGAKQRNVLVVPLAGWLQRPFHSQTNSNVKTRFRAIAERHLRYSRISLHYFPQRKPAVSFVNLWVGSSPSHQRSGQKGPGRHHLDHGRHLSLRHHQFQKGLVRLLAMTSPTSSAASLLMNWARC